VVSSRDILWARLPEPLGRRPVCVLTRDVAIPVLLRLTIAPITTTVRGISTEVPVGRAEGLTRESVITCDNLLTVDKSLLEPTPVGHLSSRKRVQLNAALAFALEIRM
jgi:mRNA interferase MazF